MKNLNNKKVENTNKQIEKKQMQSLKHHKCSMNGLNKFSQVFVKKDFVLSPNYSRNGTIFSKKLRKPLHAVRKSISS